MDLSVRFFPFREVTLLMEKSQEIINWVLIAEAMIGQGIEETCNKTHRSKSTRL